MEQIPTELVREIRLLGRQRFLRLRRGVATLKLFEIDEATIVDRLVVKGCSSELAAWLAQKPAPGEETEAAGKVWRIHQLLKSFVCLAFLVNIGILASVVQRLNSLPLVVLVVPFLMILSAVFLALMFFWLVEGLRGKPRD